MDVAVEKPLTNGYLNGHDENHFSETQETPVKKVITETMAEKQSGITSLPATLPTTTTEVKPTPLPTPAISKHRTIEPNGRVEIKLGHKGITAETPLTVPQLLNRTVARYPDNVAVATKQADGTWDTLTFKQYKEQIRICAKAFLKLGLERYHSVCILGFNSIQWFISDIAAIHAGGFAAGVYTTNNPEACFHVLYDSHAQLAIVEDSKQMDKIVSIWERLPKLKAVVQWDGKIKDKKNNMYTWEELMEIGKKEPDNKLDEVLKEIKPNECCTLVYTSGTVGQPKGVMLSHDNLTWEALAVTDKVGVDPGYEVMVSYLPLSHVAAQILDIYLPLYNAISVYFADKDALKGSIVKTLQEVKPTRFLGVPRVWEKIHEKMMAIGASSGFIKRTIANWAKSKSLNHHLAMMHGEAHSPTYGFRFAQSLILRKVKEALGFSNCVTFFTAAAPLSPEVKRYFMSLDMPIMDVFGMSESGGAHCMCTDALYDINSIGTALPGTESKIYNPDPQTGEGELCMKGRHIFMGYINNMEKTLEALDDEGWLHSGDIAKIDERGCIFITGRLKELIITAGGENVAPVLIENELKKELPCVSQAVVIGDRRKFLSVLLTLKTEVDMESGAPLDELSSDSIRWFKNIGCEAKTMPEILNGSNEKVFKAIEEGIARANARAISNAQKVQKFAILPKDLSVATEELGPTLKLKRNVVAAKYASVIDSLYDV